MIFFLSATYLENVTWGAETQRSEVGRFHYAFPAGPPVAAGKLQESKQVSSTTFTSVTTVEKLHRDQGVAVNVPQWEDRLTAGASL